jgi:protein-tyrosine phosphatase
MVCLGNICRSPLAEGIMLDLIAKQNLTLQVDSAGTSNYHIDEQPNKRTIANAKKHGIDLTPLRARQFTTNDFNLFDVIYVMDNSNYNNVIALANSEEGASKGPSTSSVYHSATKNKLKVKLFLSENKNSTYTEVPDPYFGGEQGFETVYQLVHQTCEIICNNYN